MSGARVKVKANAGQTALQKMLIDVRRRHGWTQHDLAGELGCTRNTIARWESGSREPRLLLIMPALRELHARSTDPNGISTAPI